LRLQISQLLADAGLNQKTERDPKCPMQKLDDAKLINLELMEKK